MGQQRMLLQQAQQQSFEDLDENMNTQRTIKVSYKFNNFVCLLCTF